MTSAIARKIRSRRSVQEARRTAQQDRLAAVSQHVNAKLAMGAPR